MQKYTIQQNIADQLARGSLTMEVQKQELQIEMVVGEITKNNNCVAYRIASQNTTKYRCSINDDDILTDVIFLFHWNLLEVNRERLQWKFWQAAWLL